MISFWMKRGEVAWCFCKVTREIAIQQAHHYSRGNLEIIFPLMFQGLGEQSLALPWLTEPKNSVQTSHVPSFLLFYVTQWWHTVRTMPLVDAWIISRYFSYYPLIKLRLCLYCSAEFCKLQRWPNYQLMIGCGRCLWACFAEGACLGIAHVWIYSNI